MRTETAELLDHLAAMAQNLSPSAVSGLAERIAGLRDSKEAKRLLSSAATPRAREMVSTLANLWARIPELDPNSLSLALLSAQRTASVISQSQSADLIWTGPSSQVIPVRRTDQALYELIESSTSELLVVSYVAYRVGRVVSALRRAVDRQVDVKVVLEIGEESGGKASFDVPDEMSRKVAGAKVYYWPVERRDTDRHGRYGALHAKCAVSDRASALVSSANLTEYALELNMELGILVKGGNLPNRIASHFKELMARNVLVETNKES